MKLKVVSPIVSVDWLNENSNASNLIILDASIKKVGSSIDVVQEKFQIPNAVFFDLKNVFLDVDGKFPNTIPDQQYFEEQIQQLGINDDSCVIIYDDLGVYSSPRAWWLFKLFSHDNVAVLNGGFPEWKKRGYTIENPKSVNLNKGNFRAKFNANYVVNYQEVLDNITSNTYCVADARSNDRFLAKVPEPRKDLKGGHIPNSKSLPYSVVQNNGKMKSKEALITLFESINSENKDYIFTCGSGVTACILALALEITENTNYSVYDGSWTEWASISGLPIAN
ncbi:sulfurtransferase [Tenacibaculum sp. MEBiC06402]|uniref:sulfurtransferase n=1 Tax=unclassified Tenacibaculum TaxID=2635139 RepID=UPI003B98F5D9